MTDARDHNVPDEHHVHRTGGWLSQDRRHHHNFMRKTITAVDNSPGKELHPVLKELQDMVYKDARLYMLFTEMFNEIPHSKRYLKDPSGQTATIRDFEHMLQVLSYLIETAPAWTDAGHSVGIVGVPFNAILDWSMGTRSGFVVFQDPQVNSQFKKILDVWGEFLTSPESAKVLGDDKEGWFGKTGLASLEEVGNRGEGNKRFHEMFVCDPKATHYGFKSWDDFFTRRLQDGFRPIASPQDDDILVNACESKTYKVTQNAHRRDKFWLKGQPYSVYDMLANDPCAEEYVGGTIYQAFLSALSYHRWHSPVTGTIKRAYVVPGTYFSEPLPDIFIKGTDADIPLDGENTCQEYLSVMATRAIIHIESDNPKIGMMVFQGIGMTEVSTCEITVKEGQRIKKGDQLGSFHFGGSTWCAMFRKGVKLVEFPQPGAKYNVPVLGKLCRVVG